MDKGAGAGYSRPTSEKETGRPETSLLRNTKETMAETPGIIPGRGPGGEASESKTRRSKRKRPAATYLETQAHAWTANHDEKARPETKKERGRGGAHHGREAYAQHDGASEEHGPNRWQTRANQG